MVCTLQMIYINYVPISVAGGTFTSARLIYVAGREGYLPAMFGRLHKSRKTPLNALLLHAALTIMYIVIGGGFRSLINFSVVASWAFYFLTVCKMFQCFKIRC